MFYDLSETIKTQAHRNKKSFAILFIDIDGFKAVNDALGHNSGDELLKDISKRILSRLRGTDLISRLGGDEFIILLNDIDSHNSALKLANSIIDLIGSPFQLKDGSVHVGCSIGISLYPEHGHEIEELIKNADTAMYNVKNSGKNSCVIYDLNKAHLKSQP